jgi:hypothetical protein
MAVTVKIKTLEKESIKLRLNQEMKFHYMRKQKCNKYL